MPDDPSAPVTFHGISTLLRNPVIVCIVASGLAALILRANKRQAKSKRSIAGAFGRSLKCAANS